MEQNVVLEMRDISKNFTGVRALSHVDFTLRKGEIHALMGENGAGKSTLIKVLTGVHEFESGSIHMAGNSNVIVNHSPQEAQANGIVPIAFECSDGVKSILSPNEINGLLIPPFDLEAYAKKLLFVMNNTEARKRIQKNVIEKSKSYSPEVIGEKWIELLNTIGHKS